MSETFWDFAKNTNKIASLDDVFSDWATKGKLTLKEAKEAWESINNDIRMVFAAGGMPTNTTGLSITEPTPAPNAGLATSIDSVEEVNKEDATTLIKGILTS